MSPADNAADVNRLLRAAAETIGKLRYCWLLTAAGEGGIRPRPMGRVPRDSDEDEWTLRFITGTAASVPQVRRCTRRLSRLRNEAVPDARRQAH
jgi:hypothetical protein